MKDLFFRPKKAWVGDVIPFYHDGVFRIYYLHDERGNGMYGDTTWFETHTTDFVSFTEAVETIPRGGDNEQDYYVYTGDIIEKDGLFHLFYTGVNPAEEFCKEGGPLQAVMHAVSDDLKTWKKVPEDTFYSPGDIYEVNDWRDPFVFWNEEKEEYWMLLASRLKEGPSRRRGCIALCTSKDLSKWEVKDPFWAPNLYMTHECPDLFKMGDWWYLVYSTFTDKFVTHYRMSKSLDGPWLAPTRDSFDGRAFYAAKTLSDGDKRYVCAWNPTKRGGTDRGDWEWAGTLITHEIVQNHDGTLDVKMPDSMYDAFENPQEAKFNNVFGKHKQLTNGIELGELDTYSSTLSENHKTPHSYMITGDITVTEQTRGCGVMLKSSADMDRGYYVRFEPDRNRIVFDFWPRKEQGTEQWQIGGDIAHAIELERDFEFEIDKTYHIQILVEGTMGVAYVNDQVAMNFRMYDLDYENWGVFVSEGKAKFENFTLYHKKK